MFELVSSRSRDPTRRAVCHLRPGQRGHGANQTNRDSAGTLAVRVTAHLSVRLGRFAVLAYESTWRCLPGRDGALVAK
jgi:hypothetical protein